MSDRFKLCDRENELRNQLEKVWYFSNANRLEEYHLSIKELKNKIIAGEKYIVLSSTNLPKEILIDRFYVQGEEKDVYSVASSIITFKCEEHLLPYDIIRLKK